MFLTFHFKHSNGTKGFWDSTGCRVNISSESYTICKCNHLTNFAILMDSQGTISDHKSTYLTTLSISLLSLSILCLVFTIISHVIAKPLKNRKGMITLNLSCCMLVAQILLPVGSAKPDNKIACGVLAGLTEYFWLATFMWMLWEGYYVYKMLIKVFNPQSLPFQWFFVTSYAIPAIPIFISAAIKPDGYLNIKGDTCWITSEDGFRWSFMAPVCLVILINTIIYSLTLKSAKNAMISNTSKASFTRLFKGSASLFAILGLTWIFGILIPVSNVFSAIFIVFNASQGVFIFFFHVVINQSARRDIMQRLTTFKFLGTSQSSGSGSSSGLRNKGTSSDDSKRTSVFKLSSYSSSTK
ncbi:CD97 (predicted) [Pycnogonum litorale]